MSLNISATEAGQPLQRAAPEPAQPGGGPGDPLLDATYATILDFGLSKATVSEVAKRAGLSRMTVYRRYRDGKGLIRALMTRQFTGLLMGAGNEAQQAPDSLQRAVTLVVRTVELLSEDPLLLRLLELEPELLLPYTTARTGHFQEIAREQLASEIARGQQEGSIRPGDPSELAATIELACRGLVYSTRALSSAERKRALQELRALIEGYLRAQG